MSVYTPGLQVRACRDRQRHRSYADLAPKGSSRGAALFDRPAARRAFQPPFTLYVRGQKKQVRPYGERVLRRSGKRARLPGGRKARVALRNGVLKGVGEVLVLFSRRQGETKVVAIVTNDLMLTAEEILAGYSNRWPIESAFKDQKQNLGLGDYQTRSLRGVVTHLHLVAIAHVLLTHHAVQALGARAKKPNVVLLIPTVQQLRDQVRHILWNDALKQLKKKIRRPAARRFIEELHMAA